MRDDRLPLGDLIRALTQLSDPALAPAVAASLGYALARGASPQAPRVPVPRASDAPRAPPREPSQQPRRDGPFTDVRITSLPTPTDAGPALIAAPPLPPPPRTVAAPPPASLLPAATARALLLALARRPVADGEPDVPALIDATARRSPVRRLPRRCRMRLGGEVRVLVDRAEGMTPYDADQDAVVAALRGLLAGRPLRVYTTAGPPSAGLADGEGEEVVWTAPPARAAVIVLSDLGLGPASGGTDGWTEFAEEARARGCAVVALVPVSPARWPPRLARAVGMVAWDRTARVQDARRASAR